MFVFGETPLKFTLVFFITGKTFQCKIPYTINSSCMKIFSTILESLSHENKIKTKTLRCV